MEREFLTWLADQVPADPRIELGPGDDAAIVQLAASGRCVVTSDMLMDQIDFDLQRVGAAQIGRKSLAVNLSDLAAMAARPVAAIISLALPRSGGVQLAKQLYAGLLPLARDYHLAVAGGDTNSWDGPLVLSITALGEPTERGPLLRSGARPGDRILVTGSFGGSLLGKHLDFQPRVQEALQLHDRYTLHAAIDVSDGLSLDLFRLAQASRCGAQLDLQRVPISEAARKLAASSPDGRTPLEHALGDGEDFELILAAPPAEADRILRDQPLGVPVTAIGQFIDQPGLWTATESGRLKPLEPDGYEH